MSLGLTGNVDDDDTSSWDYYDTYDPYPGWWFAFFIIAFAAVCFLVLLFATPTYWNGTTAVVGTYIDEEYVDQNGHRVHRHTYRRQYDPYGRATASPPPQQLRKRVSNGNDDYGAAPPDDYDSDDAAQAVYGNFVAQPNGYAAPEPYDRLDVRAASPFDV